MPIVDVQFKDGVLFAREEGRITEADAREWARMIATYIEEYHAPVVSIIDATAVTYIEQDARKVFVRAANMPQFVATAVVTNDPLTIQTARVLGMMAPDQHTHVFSTLEEAEAFVRDIIAPA
jgi:anti-anti-sigma regulatory factor